MKKIYAMYVGRWQTWHEGHEWLVRQQLEKGKNCWIAIRDVEVGPGNPHTAHEVLMNISQTDFFKENSDKLHLSIIPDIESFNYGRDVGYEVIEHTPPEDISKISGTSIRNQGKK
jgi:nicotinamide mononucleotide adenylyltransferase